MTHHEIKLGQISETYENKDRETTFFTIAFKERLSDD